MKHTIKENPRQAFGILFVWIAAILLGAGFWIALDHALCKMIGC